MPIINSRPSKEVDYKATPHVGTLVTKDGRYYGDKRCVYCGDWITWVDIEPEFCFEPSVVRKLSGSGRGQCEDFYNRRQVFLQRKRDEVAERAIRVTELLRRRGLIA